MIANNCPKGSVHKPLNLLYEGDIAVRFSSDALEGKQLKDLRVVLSPPLHLGWTELFHQTSPFGSSKYIRPVGAESSIEYTEDICYAGYLVDVFYVATQIHDNCSLLGHNGSLSLEHKVTIYGRDVLAADKMVDELRHHYETLFANRGDALRDKYHSLDLLRTC